MVPSDNKLLEPSDQECPVCGDRAGSTNKCVTLSCRHSLCTSCLHQWATEECQDEIKKRYGLSAEASSRATAVKVYETVGKKFGNNDNPVFTIVKIDGIFFRVCRQNRNAKLASQGYHELSETDRQAIFNRWERKEGYTYIA
jgi:hypothetical protein